MAGRHYILTTHYYATSHLPRFYSRQRHQVTARPGVLIPHGCQLKVTVIHCIVAVAIGQVDRSPSRQQPIHSNAVPSSGSRHKGRHLVWENVGKVV